MKKEKIEIKKKKAKKKKSKRFLLVYKVQKENSSPTHIFEATEIKQWFKQGLQLYHSITDLQ